jgi:hypothetical protein
VIIVVAAAAAVVVFPLVLILGFSAPVERGVCVTFDRQQQKEFCYPVTYI